MRLLVLPTILGLTFAGQILVSGSQAEATTHRYRLAYWQAHIAQAQGRVSRDLPSQREAEKGAGKTGAASVDRPTSCNSANAATPYCYTATQQSQYPPEGELFASAQARALMDSRAAQQTTSLPTRAAVGLAVLGALSAVGK